MKKLLVLLLLLAFSNHSYSQDYTPLLDYYNEWNLRFCFASICDTDLYYTNGDTLVDGMNYKVLDGYHYISRGFLLRENIPERKVYLKVILPSGISDYLLYDFSLPVGDSIDMKNPITPFPEDAGYFTVDSIIPRPLVDGNHYRHFYFSPSASNTVSTNNAIWIEGVGSMSIITAPSGDPDINGVGRVACMFKNGESFYSDLDIIDECEPLFILDTSSFEDEKNIVKAITTPSTNVYEIINIADITTIQLYNLSGVILESFENDNRDSISLNLNKYPSGIYILVLKANNNSKQVLKIIVA
ncbi:MAG: T9SS type A sorting domain-containing protein [Altibacter sp.]|uniref:T9SS type A sorting domain-containing protein n=1 Tax=Altibacter sp. TaxID=2024823 RepID=UPI001E0FC80B|nr:T9SS type A sorting domain-containing protein [Altibacter sp.]MBZ0328294.1 T9SS type A sorting domain-containing protein [Altibacter sp.]